MDLGLRAKIFIPFEPLKGFREALAERERAALATERQVLSQDQRVRMSQTLAALGPGDLVRVSHYLGDHYEVTVGQVSRVLLAQKVLVVGEAQIAFDDLLELDRL